MPGLFGTLDLGARSLQTQQQGVQVAGHNIANVNNPAYSRQRVTLQTSSVIMLPIGVVGTGADAVGIVRLRSELLDQQIQDENSVSGFLDSRQNALQNAQAGLAQTVDTRGGLQNGLAGSLSDFFNAFQSLSTNASSLSERQVLLQQADALTSQFNQVDNRLAKVESQLNISVETDVAKAGNLMQDIAGLNEQIVRTEAAASNPANDLRDTRQQKLEELAKLVKIDVTKETNGTLSIAIGGTTFVSGQNVVDTLETYDPGDGRLLVRAQASGAPLTLTSGTIAGTIDARDVELASLRGDINMLASTLITEVNALHRDGYNLQGGTAEDFFVGSNAGDIQVNPLLAANPALLQASGESGATSDNQVAVALAGLGTKELSSLNGQTFVQRYSQSVAALGSALSSSNTRVDDQKSVQSMLGRQRDSVSGVSLDEEMTDMMRFQRAFEASARLISVVDDMLDTVVNMKR